MLQTRLDVRRLPNDALKMILGQWFMLDISYIYTIPMVYKPMFTSSHHVWGAPTAPMRFNDGPRNIFEDVCCTFLLKIDERVANSLTVTPIHG